MDYNNYLFSQEYFILDPNILPAQDVNPSPSPNPAPTEAVAQKAIAESTELAKRPAKDIGLAKRIKRSYSDHQMKMMREGSEAGKSPRMIGSEIGLSGRQVSDWLRNNSTKNEKERKKPMQRHQFTEEENQIITESRTKETPESYVKISGLIRDKLGISINEDQVRHQSNKLLSNDQKIAFRYTEEQDGIIAQMIEDGFRYNEIANALTTTPEQKAAGVNKFTAMQIDNRWHNSLSPLYPAIKYRFSKKTFSKEDDEKIRDAKRDGKKDSDIALELNRSVKSIESRKKIIVEKFLQDKK